MSNCMRCGKPTGGFWSICEECEYDMICEICGRWLDPGECYTCSDCLENGDEN